MRPSVPPEISELFAQCTAPLAPGDRLVYRAGLVGTAKVHFVRATYNVDTWKTLHAVQTLRTGELPEPLWDDSLISLQSPEFLTSPPAAGEFDPIPQELLNVKAYKGFEKQLADHLYRSQSVVVRRCQSLKLLSEPDEHLDDFRIRAAQLLREERDRAVEKLREKHAGRLAAIQSQIGKAEERISREKSQYRHRQIDTAVSLGQTVLGALFGRKLASRTNVGRASTSARSVTRTAREYSDVGRAEEALEDAKKKLADEEAEFAKELQELHQTYTPDRLEIEELHVKPKKSDVNVEQLAFIWLPWRTDQHGRAERAW
jgi:hypothetical protein